MKKIIKVIRGGSTESILALGPALRSLRTTHPDSEIFLETEEACLEAASLLPGLDQFGKFGSGPENPDLLFNLDLASPQRGQESLDWLCYEALAPTLRLGNPYHAVDLARKSLGSDLIDANYELKRFGLGESSITQLINEAEGLKLAICAASLHQDEIDSILSSLRDLPIPCEVFFIGTVKDRKNTAALRGVYDNVRFHDLCGRVSVAEASELFFWCDVCLAGPGSSALLSSGHGTFTICLDKNPEHGPFHYPYGHGHLIVQSQRQGSFPAEIGDLLSGILQFTLQGNNGTIPVASQWQSFFDESLDKYLGKVRIYITQRVEVPVQSGATLTEFYLRPLVFLGAEYHDTIQVFYRLLWEMSLSDRNLESNDLEILHQDTIPALCEILKPLEQIYELAKFGGTYCSQVASSLSRGDIERAKHDSARLQEVDDLIRSVGSAYAGLQAICEFHLLRQGQIQDENPILLANVMKKSYDDLQSRVLVLLDLSRTLFHTNLREGSPLRGGTAEEDISNG